MGFVEIKPPDKPAKGIGTGVRVSVTDRHGLRVSIAGDALGLLTKAKGDPRFRVLHDADPALPRLRIIRDDADGRFALLKPPLGDTWRFITVGRRPWLPPDALKGLDCTWEIVEGMAAAIDIDLPREFRRTQSVDAARTAPSTSYSNARTSSVTLPGRAPVRGRV